MQAYSDLEREDEPTALPDVEVWSDVISEATYAICDVFDTPYDEAHATETIYCTCGKEAERVVDTEREGWFWQDLLPRLLARW